MARAKPPAARATPHVAWARSIPPSPYATSPDAVRPRGRVRRETSNAKREAQLQSSPAAEDYGRAAKLKKTISENYFFAAIEVKQARLEETFVTRAQEIRLGAQEGVLGIVVFGYA